MFREIDKDNRDCCNYLDAEYREGVLRLTTCGACFYGSSIRGLPNYDTIETVLTEEEYNAIKDYIRISRGILSDVKHLVKHIKPIVEQATDWRKVLNRQLHLIILKLTKMIK